jgi:hypothetical protein
MRKIICTLIAIAAFAALSGCSHKVTTSNGSTVTTSGDNQTVTIEGNGGKVVAGKGAVDVAKLGMPIYPGADASDNAGWSGQSKEGAGAMAVMKTKDPFDKVYAWYQHQLPAGAEQIHTTSGGSSMAVFKIGKDSDKEQKSITISSDSEGTSIMLVSGTKGN